MRRKEAKDYVIIGIVIFVGVFGVLLFWLHLLDWSYGGNKEVIIAAIGLIGAIIGGTISGLLTLMGVRLTIREQRYLYNREKYEKAIYISSKLNPAIINLRTVIGEFGKTNAKSGFDEVCHTIKEVIRTLRSYSGEIKGTEYHFINLIESIEHQLSVLDSYLNKEAYEEMIINQDINKVRTNLMVTMNYINQNFERIQKYIKDIEL